MQKRLLNEAEAYAKRNHRRQVWRKLVRMMACVVVFCTTYALILPAITMERSQCELEEHIHSESCYAKVTTRQQQTLSCTYDSLSVHQHTPECRDGEGTLICGYGDYLVHEHDAACTDEAGILVCQLPVVKAHTHTEEDCFAPVEMETEHIHEDTCYTLQRGELLCQIEETPGHAHGDECYTLGELQCQLEEREGHTHTETCTEKILLCDLTVEPHVHTDACYRQLTCDLSTEPAHTHTDACTGRTLTCTSEEEGHEHTDACYLQLTCDLSTEPLHTHTDACTGRVLECQQTEQPHIHTDECYQVNDLCGQEEQEGHTHTRACYASELTCEAEETEGHAHTDECYEQLRAQICDPVPAEPELELICEKPEVVLHTHTDACYETYLDEAGAEQRRLICPELEILEHIHTGECFVVEQLPADTQTLTCTEPAAHVHGEACYDEAGELICTESTEGHTHGERCYGTWELICGKEEHTHSAECSALLGLPEEDRLAVEEVIALIEPLPTYDDMMAKLDEFYEADDMEGEEAYMMEVYAQVEEAYRAYMALPEELREYVTNADKLMELEFIWSRITLEEDLLPSSGEWVAQTLSASKTVALTGDVQVTGTIIIPYGVTLNIEVDDTASGSVMIRRASANAALMFYLKGGTLNITGSSGKHIVLDGGTALNLTVGGTQPDGTIAGQCIRVDDNLSDNSTGGTLNATYCTIQNMYNKFGAEGLTAGASAVYMINGTALFQNSTIQNCVNENDHSIVSAGQNYAVTGDKSTVTFNSCRIVNNVANCRYSGVLKFGGPQVYCNLTMRNCYCSGNYSSGWGGCLLWAANSGGCKAVLDNCTFTGNTAAYLGGAISNEAMMEVSNCSITGNTAMAGGGIASFPFTLTEGSAGGGNACGLTLLDGNIISGNTSTATEDFTPFNTGHPQEITNKITYPAGGGGIWVYMNKAAWTCSLDIGSGNVVRFNTAENNGGGIFVAKVAGSTTTLSVTGAEVTNNTAKNNGGGVALQDADLIISDGKITNNTAINNGGGVYCDGMSTTGATISGNGSIDHNTAKNGGGIFVDSGKLNIEGGFIVYNNAVGTPVATVTTAYDYENNVGVGGGAYVNSGELSINTSGGIGIYSNLADFAADDIFTDPANTKINIPAVTDMNLTGYGNIGIGKASNWYEDYAKDDTKYTAGLNGKTADQPVVRYRKASEEEKVAYAGGTTETNKYICLTLGYELEYGDLTITKDVVDGSSDEEFTFTVEVSAGGIGEGEGYTVTDDNKATFTLRDGESVTLKQIQYTAKVTITESQRNDYAVSVKIGTDSPIRNNVATFNFMGENVAFTNTRVMRDLTIEKQVVGGGTAGIFQFVVSVKDNGSQWLPETSALPVGATLNENGEIEFTLSHDQSITIPNIPANSDVTISEVNWQGYVVEIQKDETNLGYRNSVEFVLTDDTEICVINTVGYELPHTGGAGTYLYTTGGLLIMAAAILLYIHNLRRRKEAMSSF